MALTREELATHEAGHAVVAHVLRWSIQRVWLGAGPDENSGCCPIAGADSTWQDRICYFLAGIAANLRMAGQPFTDDLLRLEPMKDMGGFPRAWGQDLQKVRELAEQLEPLGEYVDRPLGRDRAVSLVGQHWPAVTTLAEALSERGELRGDEAHAIIASALPRGFPRNRDTAQVRHGPPGSTGASATAS